jgi:CubicO group peptidase (beta-lactamase class C family)
MRQRVLLLLFTLGVLCQSTLMSARQGPPSLTAADLTVFFDGLIPAELQRADIAGATVAVVKDGALLVAKGYGYADVETGKPVVADTTLFRPGSISKLFVWTAVMQLVEQGRLDLDKDVNAYLDFQIPATFPEPITLRHIMTHTPGFEEFLQDLFVEDASKLTPLGEYLPRHLPRRMFRPGTVPAYSNYATTLAGYIVQRTSGQPFEAYVEDHIFKPLAMTRTTFRQPLPAGWEDAMSSGYTLASDEPKPFEVVGAFPAGSVSTTATDIARFMLAHLGEGATGDARILKPETVRTMHARQFGMSPEMNAMALGFYEESRNGLRIIGHAGDTQSFHSDLHLIGERGVGFYISFNSGGRFDVLPRSTIWRKFLDRYFPYQRPETKAVTSPSSGEVEGYYLVSRRADSTLLRPFGLLGALDISATADGDIEADALNGANGKPLRFKEVSPMMYESAERDRLQFVRNADGALTAVIDYPFFVFERVSRPQDHKIVNIVVLVASLVLMLVLLLMWPVAALVRRRYGRRLELSPRDRKLRTFTRAVLAWNVASLACFVVIAVQASGTLGKLNSDLTTALRAVQIMFFAGVVGTVVVALNASRVWSSAGRGWVARVAETSALAAAIGFAWILYNWNLLRFDLRF